MLKDNEIYNIVVKYESKIRRYFSSKVSNDDDIDDLVQETLFQIIRSLPKFNKKSQISTWVYSICRNTLYNYYYQKKRQNTIFNKLNLKHTNDDLEKIENKLIIEKLEKPLNIIYDLYYRKNYKIKEIAEFLGKPEGTIKYLLYRLRIRIKKSC